MEKENKSTRSLGRGARLFLLLALLSPFAGCKQDDPTATLGIIEGVVTDAATNEPIEGASLSLSPTDRGTTTASEGQYRFIDLEPQVYTLAVSMPGYSSDEVSLSVAAGAALEVPFQLTALSQVLELSATTLDFGASTLTLDLRLANPGQNTLEWTLASNNAWISADKSQGSIAGQGADTLTITVDRNDLALGNHSGSLLIESNGGDQPVTILATVDGPVLTANPTELFFNVNEGLKTLQLSNSGRGTATYSGSTSAEFLTITPATGDVATGLDQIVVRVDRSELAAGTYNETITFTSNANTLVVPVSITAVDPTSPPQLLTGAISTFDQFEAWAQGSLLAFGEGFTEAVEHGHCWSATNATPTIADSRTTLGSAQEVGSFESQLEDLQPNTTYHVRAYASNASGTGYGEVVAFTTLPTNHWEQRADLATARVGAVAFSIGQYGYVATGNDGVFQKDLWKYNPKTNVWTQMADLPADGRSGAVAFVINNRAYLGLGETATTKLKDLWRYNPDNNEWTNRATFSGVQRSGAASFVLNDKAYVGTGMTPTGLVSDFWEYDPVNDAWNARGGMPPSANTRQHAMGFSLSGKGYILGGLVGSYPQNDLWEYLPGSNSWVSQTPFNGQARYSASVFVLDGVAYLVGGRGADDTFSDCWSYTSGALAWTDKADFEGGKRYDGVAFALGRKGYFGLGTDNNFSKKDFWDFVP